MKSINRIDNATLISESNNTKISKSEIRMKKRRFSTLRDIEEDFYEYNMRIRNVEEENDALYLMRQINIRISLIEDYLNAGEDMSTSELKRWNDLLDKYRRLREELSNTMVYKAKNYGIFVNYPDIKEDRY